MWEFAPPGSAHTLEPARAGRVSMPLPQRQLAAGGAPPTQRLPILGAAIQDDACLCTQQLPQTGAACALRWPPGCYSGWLPACLLQESCCTAHSCRCPMNEGAQTRGLEWASRRRRARVLQAGAAISVIGFSTSQRGHTVTRSAHKQWNGTFVSQCKEIHASEAIFIPPPHGIEPALARIQAKPGATSHEGG